MTKLLSLILCLFSVLPVAVFAHTGHHDSSPRVNPAAWQQHLVNFRRHGETIDLDIAREIERSMSQRIKSTSEQLYLAAQTAQADHRFLEAIDLLDQLLAQSPGHDGARLMRANTLVTLDRGAEASSECTQLKAMPLSVVFACRLMSQPSAKIYDTLVKVVDAEAPRLDPSLRAWVLATLGDYALGQNRTVAALQHYDLAYRTEPLVGYQITRVDALLRNAQCEAALEMTVQFPHHLAMQVKHAIASRQCGVPDLDTESLLSEQFAVDIAREDFSHGREMAEYHLFVTQNTDLARRIMASALKTQRTIEDERLWRLANAH